MMMISWICMVTGSLIVKLFTISPLFEGTFVSDFDENQLPILTINLLRGIYTGQLYIFSVHTLSMQHQVSSSIDGQLAHIWPYLFEFALKENSYCIYLVNFITIFYCHQISNWGISDHRRKRFIVVNTIFLGTTFCYNSFFVFYYFTTCILLSFEDPFCFNGLPIVWQFRKSPCFVRKMCIFPIVWTF